MSKCNCSCTILLFAQSTVAVQYLLRHCHFILHMCNIVTRKGTIVMHCNLRPPIVTVILCLHSFNKALVIYLFTLLILGNLQS